MDKISEQVDIFRQHDTVFCVVGITRADAKSADGYRKVELYLVQDAAIAAKQANVNHFSLLTSQGANPNMWANDWEISHIFLGAKTKGLAEQEIIKLQFPRTSIFRPGMLERPNTDRWVEKVFTYNSTHVNNLAKMMIIDAESDIINDVNVIEKPVIYEVDEIHKSIDYYKLNQ